MCIYECIKSSRQRSVGMYAQLIKGGCLWGVGWVQKEKRRANSTNYLLSI